MGFQIPNKSQKWDECGRPNRWLQRVFVTPDLWRHRKLGNIQGRIHKVAK